MFKSRKRKYNAIGINIYGGGFTLGVMKHFEVLGQWEEIDLGKKTFDLNFERIYRPLDINHWPIKDFVDKVNFVYANPPCAPWSSASVVKKTTIERQGNDVLSRFNDKRLLLTKHTYEAAIKLRPDIFISESVEAGYNIGAAHYDQYIEMWIKAGYAVTFFMSDAILQGAPCMRRRFHFIAHRYKLMLGKPPKIIKPITVKDVIHDLVNIDDRLPMHVHRSITDHTLKVAKLAKPGELLITTVSRIGCKKIGISFFMRKLRWNRPSCTIIRGDYIHPLQHRWITLREIMRLCTYPDTYLSKNAIHIADAVLPSVAEFLALVAKRTIQKAESCPVEYNFVDWRPLAKKFHINSKNYPE